MGFRVMAFSQVVNYTEVVNCAIGFVFYAFLLYCLIFRTRQNLGAYRYLQIIMISIDASFTAAQMVIRERILTADGVFAMMPTSSVDFSKEILVSYLALCDLTFIMIDFSFLYRLWAVKSSYRLVLFSNPIFITILIIVAVLVSAVWFSTVYVLFLPTVPGRVRLHGSSFSEYGIDTTSHVMVMGDYFLEDGSRNFRPFCAVAIVFVVMALCFGFMIYATVIIVRYLSDVNLISQRSIRLQRQLFVTLCLQTIIPLFCLYTPCGLTILLPLLRIDSRWIARATPILVSCFLPLDTLAVLLTMPGYHKEIRRIISCS